MTEIYIFNVDGVDVKIEVKPSNGKHTFSISTLSPIDREILENTLNNFIENYLGNKGIDYDLYNEHELN